MQQARSGAGLLLLILLLLPVAAPAQTAPAPDWSGLEAVVRAEIAELGSPGAAVAVVSGGRVLWSKGFGIANVETGESVTPSHLFHVGSVTKMLTAAAVVSL